MTEGDLACFNGFDDDGDGWVDADDPDCALLDAEVGFGDAACNNGGDDNGNGLIDAADPWCDSATADEVDPPPCANALDDDADGWVDLLDPDCGAFDVELGLDESLSCNNGVDDDLDGGVDAGDPDCWTAHSDEGPLPACANELDDDADGWFDLADPGCLESVDGSEDGWDALLPCNDGVDNDYDGAIDALDANCVVATDKESTIDVISPMGMAMLPIEAGTFEMGCTEGQGDCVWRAYEVHTVTLTRDFWIGRLEVTVEQYQALTGENPARHADCLDCPIESVNWDDAANFLNLLSDEEWLPRCFDCAFDACTVTYDYLDCVGYRLPTEGEWEFAARCGVDTQFAGSDDFLEVGWLHENAGHESQPVGLLAPNGCGLHDMTGNVMEWAADEGISTFPPDPVIDPLVETDAVVPGRVGRGGGFESHAFEFGCVADRQVLVGSAPTLGFRIARTVP